MKEQYLEHKSGFGLVKRLLTLALLLVIGTSGYAQNVVKGVVTDANGMPLAGANVIVKGTTVGATTNTTGQYTISVPGKSNTLQFSFMGYVTKEAAISGRTTINVSLDEDAARLEDVVVVGYGAQKRVHMTGSVAAVSTDEIMKTTSSNISQALVGKLPGIVSQQSVGQPGADDVTMLVRGYSSYNGTSPLVLVDGVKRQMKYVDPHDVASITVLKDASACAVYGLEGAAGVILVTTKSGSEGKATISYSGSVTLSHATTMPKMMNGTQYMQYHNLAMELDGEVPCFSEEQIAATYNGDPTDGLENHDWTTPLFRTTTMHQHNVSVAGGNSKIKYFVSGGFMSQDGILDDWKYQRGTFRSNVTAQAHKNIEVTLNVAGSVNDSYIPGTYNVANGQTGTHLFHMMLYSLPFVPAEYDGMPTSGYRNQSIAGNPTYGSAHSGFRENRNIRMETAARVEYSAPFLKGLKGSMFVSWDWWNNSGKTFAYSYDIMAAQYDRGTGNVSYKKVAAGSLMPQGNMYVGDERQQQVMLRPQVTYNNTFGKHSVGALFLYEQTVIKSSALSLGRQNFQLMDLPEISMGDSKTATNSGSSGKSAYAGYVGRVNYAYADKYLAEFAFRCDGSYLFHKDYRWGFFPSVSLGWVMSKERFFNEALPKVEFFKLRASIGELGSANVNPFLYRKSYSFVQNAVAWGGTSQSSLSNAVAYPFIDLTWERVRSTNVGFELSAWNGKLGVEFDYFYKYTYDILNSVSSVYPPSLGGHVPTQANTGAFDNRGFELVLKHRNRVGSFSYGVTGTLTYAHNRILRKQQSDNVLPWQNRLGSSVGDVWGLISDGLFQSEEEIEQSALPTNATPKVGDIKYVDYNGDGRIDSDDYVKIGRGGMPQMMFSLNLDAQWKGFDLSMLFQGAARCDKFLFSSWGNGVTDMTPLTTPFYANVDNSPLYLVENSWTPDNTDATYPRLSAVHSSGGSYGNNARISDFWKRNGAYIRLKNVTLGYTLPTKWTSKAGLQKVRVYATGTNLFTATEFKYLDPESSSHITGYYPQQRTISFGIDLSF